MKSPNAMNQTSLLLPKTLYDVVKSNQKNFVLAHKDDPAPRERRVLSIHLRLPTRVSRCGAELATSVPAASMLLRILLRYASKARCRNIVRPAKTLD